ncbi:WbuC family cupin fold metalloprotein [Geomonas sp.]|uniref:WbuC family cupin fold metalloprotein n=1 Tax=Geomonas sp. TaxID=2651584 RepID=UPI002B4855D5|nr:WbuC family cupin fold metalloprotein [Geomonas sp.]HJV34317.1 WbuC family cupin fold metalloprotein [Geomonas sp.]
MKAIGREELDQLSREASDNPRLRKNLNLHPSDQSACHRLFNAIEPGSYIRPHRHLADEKDETFLLVRGALGIVSFDEQGQVTGTSLMKGGEVVAVDIPRGQYHGAVSLEKGTIFFEAKAGPYLPLSEKEKAPFAPEEGSPEAAEYLKRLEELFTTPSSP